LDGFFFAKFAGFFCTSLRYSPVQGLVDKELKVADSLLAVFLSNEKRASGCLGCMGVILPFVAGFIISHYRNPY